MFAIEDVQVNGIVGHLHKERIPCLRLLLHEVTGAFRDAKDLLGILLCRRTAGTLASTGSVVSVTVADVITHLAGRHVIEAHIPLAKMCGLVCRVGLLEHQRQTQLLAVVDGPVLLVLLVDMPCR